MSCSNKVSGISFSVSQSIRELMQEHDVKEALLCMWILVCECVFVCAWLGGGGDYMWLQLQDPCLWPLYISQIYSVTVGVLAGMSPQDTEPDIKMYVLHYHTNTLHYSGCSVSANAQSRIVKIYINWLSYYYPYYSVSVYVCIFLHVS